LNGTSDLIETLKNRGVHRVALQFPEGLKRRSVEVIAALKDAGFDVIVSGDPCYGACDLALDTLNFADVLVHFGHSPIETHPHVIFEPYKIDFDIRILENALPFLKGQSVGLVTTVQHIHLVPALEKFLHEKRITVIVSEGSGRTPNRGQVLGCNFAAAKATGADDVLFVGTGLFHPVGIAIATNSRVIALDPCTGDTREVNGDTLLRRRFALIEKTRNAKTIGIIVSTKHGQQRMELAQRLVKLSPEAVIVTMREVNAD
jgi:2-(3-amino-3-carboxypropyl)histidine synthase